MPNVLLNEKASPFDFGAVAAADGANWVLVAEINASGRRVALSAQAAVAALTALKIEHAASPDGPWRTLYEGADFDAASAVVPLIQPATGAATLASGAILNLLLAAGSSAYRIYTKANTGATLRVKGIVSPEC